MRRLLLAAILACGLAPALAPAPAAADILANWNVSAYTPANNSGPVNPLVLAGNAPNVSATSITAGPGVQSLDPCGGPLSLTACAGPAQMWVQYFTPQFDPTDYFEFAVTAAPGYEITYQNFQVPLGVLYIVDRQTPGSPRSTGPKTWELQYSLDHFATPGTTLWNVSPFPFSIQGIPGQIVGASEEVRLTLSIAALGTRQGTVTFRLYGYNPETQHPQAPLGYGGGPINRTFLGWPRHDAAVIGTVQPAAPPACYANCDGSTQAPVLNVQDFSCFLTRYAAGEAYANCDGSTQAPVLNVQDFSCFLTKYAAGCQ